MTQELEKLICNWRVTKGVPSGLHIWFDPNVESVRLYRVPTRDQRSVGDPDATLDAGVGPAYLDKVGSVSAAEDEASTALSNEVHDSDLGLDPDLPF